MLTLENVQFQHQNTALTYDFSLIAVPGDVVCIMGASGSGKSTLLDLIAGFLLPQSGVILWQDDDLIALPPEDRPTTILFQSHNLFDHLSAARNVAIGINPARSISTDEQAQVDHALKLVGLGGKENQRASTLSGGQQQRVALARAIVRNRPILLLDEPFSGLDDTTKSKMMTLVQDEAVKHQKCVIMVTHDVSDCEAIANKRVTIHDGRITEVNQ